MPNVGVGGDSLNELILGLLLDATTAQQALPTQIIAHDAFLCDTWGSRPPHLGGHRPPSPGLFPGPLTLCHMNGTRISHEIREVREFHAKFT